MPVATKCPHSPALGLLAIAFLFLCSFNMRADDVDDFISAQMARLHLAGLSLAIVDDGQIVKAQGYGFTDKSGTTPVTTNTLFQAGSISKSVAALGTLRLIQDGKLSLDADVNTELHSWKLPENKFTEKEKVTLRRILSHNAGLTVHGFLGYATNGAVPTLAQVLDGAPPANSSPIRVDIVPGSKWRYSGGGYVVMQQMVIDATGESYPDFIRHTVLNPLGMTNSTYEQPLPPSRAASAATGYYNGVLPVAGRWHVYPEMTAAGLWTTASDLARFEIAVQQSFAGKSNPVLSQTTTREMLTTQSSEPDLQDGLGVFLIGSGDTLQFSHGGRNSGFDAQIFAYARAGKGAAIMINANDNTGAIKQILDVIARHYAWPSFNSKLVD